MPVEVRRSFLGIPLPRRPLKTHGESFISDKKAQWGGGTHLKEVSPNEVAAYIPWIGGGLMFYANYTGTSINRLVEDHAVQCGGVLKKKPAWRSGLKERGNFKPDESLVDIGAASVGILDTLAEGKDGENRQDRLFGSAQHLVNGLIRLGEATDGRVWFRGTSLQIQKEEMGESVAGRTLVRVRMSRDDEIFEAWGTLTAEGYFEMSQMEYGLVNSPNTAHFNAEKFAKPQLGIFRIAGGLRFWGNGIYKDREYVQQQIEQKASFKTANSR